MNDNKFVTRESAMAAIDIMSEYSRGLSMSEAAELLVGAIKQPVQPSETRELFDGPLIETVLENWGKWALSTGLDEQNHDLVDALKEISASRNVAEECLCRVLQECNEYLPPGGIDAKACIGKILTILDPWPLAAGAPPQPVQPESTK